MRITYRKVVHSTLDTRIAANWKIGLIPFNVKRRTMNASDPKPFVAGFARRKCQCQIVLASFRAARTGIEHDVRRKFVAEIVSIDDVHPLWKPSTKWMRGSPDGLRRERIMVPGQ